MYHSNIRLGLNEFPLISVRKSEKSLKFSVTITYYSVQFYRRFIVITVLEKRFRLRSWWSARTTVCWIDNKNLIHQYKHGGELGQTGFLYLTSAVSCGDNFTICVCTSYSFVLILHYPFVKYHTFDQVDEYVFNNRITGIRCVLRDFLK